MLRHYAVNRGCGGWFPPFSLVVMVIFQGRPFPHLRGLNPDSPTANTGFVANSRFVPASIPVGRQK